MLTKNRDGMSERETSSGVPGEAPRKCTHMAGADYRYFVVNSAANLIVYIWSHSLTVISITYGLGHLAAIWATRRRERHSTL